MHDFAHLVAEHDGQIIVDESHAVGVVGETGRGMIKYFGLSERMHAATTLSKGLCGHGAVYAGAKDAIHLARQTPAVRGSSPGSWLYAVVSEKALSLLSDNPVWCQTLREKATYLRNGLRAIGLDILESPSAIVAFNQGSYRYLRNIQQVLFNNGIYVLHSQYIAAGSAGAIRMAVFAGHSYQDLDRLIRHIAAIV